MTKFGTSFLAAVALVWLWGCGAPNPGAPAGGLVQTGLSSDARIIDVRTRAEYAESHLQGAVNIPYDQLGDRIGETTTNKAERILVHCRSGRRSALAKATLAAQGYTNVIDLGSIANARQATGR